MPCSCTRLKPSGSVAGTLAGLGAELSPERNCRNEDASSGSAWVLHTVKSCPCTLYTPRTTPGACETSQVARVLLLVPRPALVFSRLLFLRALRQPRSDSKNQSRLTSSALLVRLRVLSPSTMLLRSTAGPRTRFCRAAAPDPPGVEAEVPASDIEKRASKRSQAVRRSVGRSTVPGRWNTKRNKVAFVLAPCSAVRNDRITGNASGGNERSKREGKGAQTGRGREGGIIGYLEGRGGDGRHRRGWQVGGRVCSTSASGAEVSRLENDAGAAPCRRLLLFLELRRRRSCCSRAARRLLLSTQSQAKISPVEHARQGVQYTHLVVLPNLPHEVIERLVDVEPLLGRSLDEAASKVLGELAALVRADLPLILEVGLICDDDAREVVLVLDAYGCGASAIGEKRERDAVERTEDLLMKGADFVERVARGDRVDQQEALARPHVLLAHSTAHMRASVHTALKTSDSRTHEYSS